jgi:hypothetical protein
MSNQHASYISVTRLNTGWWACLIIWDEDMKGWDLGMTGLQPYATKAKAVIEARGWAEAEGIKYVEPQ